MIYNDKQGRKTRGFFMGGGGGGGFQYILEMYCQPLEVQQYVACFKHCLLLEAR